MKNQHLQVQVVNDRLIISIGISTLAFAVTHQPLWPSLKTDEFLKPIVTDEAMLAAEIVTALNREEGGGMTPVSRMIDKAALEALESGAEGIKCPGDEESEEPNWAISTSSDLKAT